MTFRKEKELKTAKLILASAAMLVLSMAEASTTMYDVDDDRIASASTTDQSASTSQSSTTESPVSRDSAPQAPASTADSAASGSAAPAEGNASSGASVSSGRGSEDKATGLDRADQVAGEHGKHGRDNARAKQSGG